MLDLTKPVQTVTGHLVTLFRTDVKGPHPIQGSHYDRNRDFVAAWRADGTYPYSEHLRLSNVPTPPITKSSELYINVYRHKRDTAYRTRAEADKEAGEGRIACRKVAYTATEGEFDQ